MKLQYGLSAFVRARGDLPELPVINMFAEEAPTEQDGITLQSRPGLSDRGANMGAGQVKALFKADGVLDSGLYGIADGGLYRGSTRLGTIDGGEYASLAGYENKLFCCAGASIWGYNGGTLAPLSFPDDADVLKVLVGASRLIALRKDTEKFYWSDVLSENIDALSFASSENQPDRLRDALFIDDILILFGAETVEFWPNTGDANLPFQPLEGRVFERGVKATGCATKFGSTFAWVTSENQVCVTDPENIISKPGLEALIEASTETSLWTFQIEGAEFLALRIDAGTWVFSARSGLWSQFASYDETNWIAQCYAGGVFGASRDGLTLAWNSGHLDLGGQLERRFRAGVPINAGGVVVNNLILRANIGQTPYLAGDYADPQIELRTSRNAGQTWGAWKPKSMGAQGEYRKKLQWLGLGMFSQPGMLTEFRLTAPTPLRVSGVFANEPFGGI